MTNAEIQELAHGTVYKTEWFKCALRLMFSCLTRCLPDALPVLLVHIDPEGSMNSGHSARERLPPHTTGFQIWGDMLKKLTEAAKACARNRYDLTWIKQLEDDNKIRYIVTVPVAWQKGES